MLVTKLSHIKEKKTNTFEYAHAHEIKFKISYICKLMQNTQLQRRGRNHVNYRKQ